VKRLNARRYTRGVPEPNALPDPRQDDADVRPLPVLAEPPAIERRREVPLPTAVAAATGGFLLGVVSFVLVRVLRRPKPARLRLGSGRGRGKKVDVTASRSFLVDVHLLKDR
jgi:hypothetical protein